MSRDKKWLKEYKKNFVCSICGTPKNIHFHHITPSNKIMSVGKMDKLYGKSKVIEEIEKCVPMCGNCHDEYHKQHADEYKSLCKYNAKCCPLIGSDNCKCR